MKSEKDEKKYKRYIIVAPEVYTELKAAAVADAHLSDVEKKMLNMLRDTTYSSTQRLAFYHKLLLNNLRKVYSDPSKSTDAETRKSKNVATSTFESKNVGTDEDLAYNDFASRKSSTPIKKFQNAELENQFKTPTEFANKNAEDIFETPSGALQYVPMAHAAGNDSNDDFDADRERDNIVAEIKRMSSTPLNDFSAIKFQHHDDPNKTYIDVQNTVTGERFSINKTAGLLQKQRNKVTKKLSHSNLEPRRILDLKNHSPPKNRSGLKRYVPYEALKKRMTTQSEIDNMNNIL